MISNIEALLQFVLLNVNSTRYVVNLKITKDESPMFVIVTITDMSFLAFTRAVSSLSWNLLYVLLKPNIYFLFVGVSIIVWFCFYRYFV